MQVWLESELRASLPLEHDASHDAERISLIIAKDYTNHTSRAKDFNKICYMPCPADLSPPRGVDRVELLEVRISLDFWLSEVSSSENLFENFQNQTPTDDMDYALAQEEFGDSDQAIDTSLNTFEQSSDSTSDRETLVEFGREQNLKVFHLLEAALRVLFHGSLNPCFPRIKIVQKPACFNELIPSQCNPRYVRVRYPNPEESY